MEKAKKCLANSLVCEPTHDGCLNNEIPMELGKCNESYVVPQETKVIEGPMVAKCPGLGLDGQ